MNTILTDKIKDFNIYIYPLPAQHRKNITMLVNPEEVEEVKKLLEEKEPDI